VPWHLALARTACSAPSQRLGMFHEFAALTSMDVSKDNPTVESTR
jgi:hypothetical protein